MPSRAMYELKISGLLSGANNSNGTETAAFLALFSKSQPPLVPVAPGDDDGEGTFVPSSGLWPEGFLLPGYQISLWESVIEEVSRERVDPGQVPGPERATVMTFHAQVTRMRLGPLFDHRKRMLKEVEWFYDYCFRPWHQNLRTRVAGLNGGFSAVKVIEAVAFRDYKWYCGNGGGS